MSTQTLHQGSLRPAHIPAITVVHPGLQVHSIPAPKTDRRLSFLMSANLYCALAAGAMLVAQASPDIKKALITGERPSVLVELPPPTEIQRPVAVVAPVLANSLQPLSSTRPTVAEPQLPMDTDTLPTTIGNTDLSRQIASNPFPGTGVGAIPGTGTPTGVGTIGSSSGQPIEVSFKSVSILRQVQPVYPSLARVAHKEGDVVLMMTINEQGVPTEVRMDSGDAIFRNDAVHAAQQWRFTPANIDGQPRSARFRLTLQFRLRG
jgi:TonB family protein